MLHAIRPAALTGRTMSAATSRIPTTRIDRATVTAASAATTMLSAPIGTPATRAPSSSMTTAGERAIEDGDDGEPDSAERPDERQIRARDGEDRAEEVLEEIDVQRTRGRDENDPERDARVEDERKGLVTCRPAARAQQLDRDASDDAKTSAVRTGATSSRIPAATPANATWPMPSPVSDCRAARGRTRQQAPAHRRRRPRRARAA